MVTLLKKYGLPTSLGLLLCIITAAGIITSCGEVKHCTDPEYPLSCEKGKSCCPDDKPWNDGSSCWTDLGSCRATGYPCELCYTED